MPRKGKGRGIIHRGTYAHPNEIKFRDKKPEDGQRIACRENGHKNYYAGIYHADVDEVWLEGADFKKQVRFLMGWVPLPKKGV
jgi:hypothetical protein